MKSMTVMHRAINLAVFLSWAGVAYAENSGMYESEQIISHRAAMNRLHAAVRVGDPAAIEAALASGVDIDQTAALELAILSEREDIVDLLIEHGADVNRPGLSGDLPLSIAVRRDKPELVRRLVERGADIDLHDRRGMTPLEHARRHGGPEAVDLLRRRGVRDQPAAPR